MTEIQNTSIIELSDVSDEQMNEMIDGTLTEFDEGDLVDGTIVKLEHDEVLVDIGFKSEGVIPIRELSIRKDADPSDIVSLGDKIEALVLQKEDKDGRLILSKKRAEYERSWISVEEKFKAGEVVSGEVIEVVKGGLILDIGLRGFLPASLVDLHRVKDLDMYLGTEIEARVIEMDRNRNNVVLSRRVLLEEGRKNERAEILGKLTKGMRLKGSVSSIVDFGAFVDLGGIDGLVHISELSWNHVNHPSEVVKVGDEVEVEVLDVDLQRERISLGLKQTTPDPWAKLVEEYPVGSLVDGMVTKTVPFGAFIELQNGIEGLVHISEMAQRHIDTPAQVVKVGDQVKVKVMEINSERRRISLSMKAAAEELGIEIAVDESVQVEKSAPRKKSASNDHASDESSEQVVDDRSSQEETADSSPSSDDVSAESVSGAAADEAAVKEPDTEDHSTKPVIDEAIGEPVEEKAAPEQAASSKESLESGDTVAEDLVSGELSEEPVADNTSEELAGDNTSEELVADETDEVHESSEEPAGASE